MYTVWISQDLEGGSNLFQSFGFLFFKPIHTYIHTQGLQINSHPPILAKWRPSYVSILLSFLPSLYALSSNSVLFTHSTRVAFLLRLPHALPFFLPRKRPVHHTAEYSTPSPSIPLPKIYFRFLKSFHPEANSVRTQEINLYLFYL